MNVLILYLFIFMCCTVQPGSSGRKIYTGYNVPDHGISESYDNSPHKLKKGVDAYFKNKQYDKSSGNKHLFKLSVDELKNPDSKNSAPNNAVYSTSRDYSNDYKTLEMESGEHVVRVKSKLDTKSLEGAPQGGGYKISVNPKYSHVIEIIRRGDNIKGLASTGIKHSVEKPNTDFKTDSTTDTEELAETDEPIDSEEFTNVDIDTDYDEFTETDYEAFNEVDDSSESDEFANTDKHTDTEEFIETDEFIDSEDFTNTDDVADYDEFAETDYEEFTESNTSDTEELAERNEINSEEFIDTNDQIDYEDSTESNELIDTSDSTDTDKSKNNEEFSENNPDDVDEIGSDVLVDADDHAVSIKFVENSENLDHEEMDVQHNSDSQESSFNDDIEGSGEAFSGSQNTSKSGRLLGLFSRQNETSPNCTTPKGEAGHCRRIRQCLLSDALDNFNVFLQHLCLIRGALVGVCCPDNPVIEISNEEESNTTEISPEDIKQPPEGCGLNIKTRIVGGSISAPHEWTWMVALMKRNRFYCGGVIINNWYILTAAHCVLGTNLKDLAVRLGEYDFNENSRHREDISVSEIKRHAQFVTLTFQHDIALLKLKRSIKYSKFVGSICLPDQKARDYVDAKGTVVGWGTVSFGGSASPILREVTIPVWKNEDCDRTYLLENINDAFLCAGSPEKGEDACQGDSGGPLMALNDKGRWEVIGIVSWGRRCGDPTYPGVYTRVTTYLDWIQQNAN